MFATVTVIVDGSLEADNLFTDEVFMRDYISTVEEDAKADGYETHVYVIWHDHSIDLTECNCVQYLSDHKPTYVFNGVVS